MYTHKKKENCKVFHFGYFQQKVVWGPIWAFFAYFWIKKLNHHARIFLPNFAKLIYQQQYLIILKYLQGLYKKYFPKPYFPYKRLQCNENLLLVLIYKSLSSNRASINKISCLTVQSQG